MNFEEDIIDAYIQTELTAEQIRNEPHWQTMLSDGQTVHSVGHRRSWLELKEYLQQNPNLSITEMWLRFRDHYELIGKGRKNYLFSHAAMGMVGGPTNQYAIAGYQVDNNEVTIKKYILPEIVLVEEEQRSLDDPTVKKGLIVSE